MRLTLLINALLVLLAACGTSWRPRGFTSSSLRR